MTFRKLLLDSGVETGEPIDIIIDSILDWRDANDEHLINGAESDWYEEHYKEQGFDHPYKAKNGPFDTVEELLMVRGITKEILYGTTVARELFGDEIDEAKADKNDEEIEYKGIIQHLSVFNVSSSLNQNTASDELIQAMYPDTADQILETRKLNQGRYQDRVISSYFTITATGYLAESTSQHTVQVTVWRRGQGINTSLEIQFWKDNLIGDNAPMTTPSVDEGGDSKGDSASLRHFPRTIADSSFSPACASSSLNVPAAFSRSS
jgi:hypothetical protein